MSKRGGFPGGGFPGGMNLGNLMKEAKKMQADMQNMQEEMEQKEFSATAGGGAVKAVVTGDKKIKSIKIEKDVVDPDDVEMLQDLIMTCLNDAFNSVDAEQAQRMGKYNIPGLM